MKTIRVSLVALACAFIADVAFAANGDLDPTFGDNGIGRTEVTTAGGNGGSRPSVAADGSIAICDRVDGGSSGADFMVARFTPNGVLDTNFSFDGKVLVDFNAAGQDTCFAIATQADGKIVVAGSTSYTNSNSTDFAVARLTVDGSLDSTFGAGTGKVTIPFDLGSTFTDEAHGVSIDSQGRIVVAGTVTTATDGTDFGVVRLLSDGSLDASFNLTGKVTLGFNASGSLSKNDLVNSMILDDEGRIVIVGSIDKSPTSSLEQDFGIARLLPNGQPDQNFDADGRATVAFDLGLGDDDQAFGVVVQHDGKIMLVGAADTATVPDTNNYAMAATRLLPDGALDTDFGVGGKTLVQIDLVPNGTDAAFDVIEQSNGKLILAGYTQSVVSFAVQGITARLNVDASLDSSWGTVGKKFYDFGFTSPSSQLLRGIGVSNGRIIASGGAIVGAANEIDDFVVGLEDDLIFASLFE